MNDLIQKNSSAFDLPSFDPTSFPESQSPQPIGEKYLVFFLDGDFYAVSSKRVVEAAPFLTVTPLPNSPEWLLGIANLRGEIVSIVNLPMFFGKNRSQFTPKQKFIILRSQFFDPCVAFAADKLNEIVTLSSEDVQFDKDEKSPYIFGKALHQSNTLNLIDTEKLFSSLVI